MIDLERLERLAEAATPGPWIVAGFNKNTVRCPGYIIADTHGARFDQDEPEANAAFIAAAREAIPALIAAVRERDREVERLMDQRITILAELYKKDYVGTAKLCDETLDRSGALLGYVRQRARSALGGQS